MNLIWLIWLIFHWVHNKENMIYVNKKILRYLIKKKMNIILTDISWNGYKNVIQANIFKEAYISPKNGINQGHQKGQRAFS